MPQPVNHVLIRFFRIKIPHTSFYFSSQGFHFRLRPIVIRLFNMKHDMYIYVHNWTVPTFKTSFSEKLVEEDAVLSIRI